MTHTGNPWSIPPAATGFAVEDLYKLLHQAYQGPGHAIPSPAGAEKYLREEWAGLGPTRPDESLLEIPTADASFVRIHLRPYRDRGGTIETLLDAFLKSGAVPIEPEAFRRAWEEAGRQIRDGKLHLDAESYAAIDAETLAAGYPAIHHSPAYLEKADPAYRVLARVEAEQLARSLGAC